MKTSYAALKGRSSTVDDEFGMEILGPGEPEGIQMSHGRRIIKHGSQSTGWGLQSVIKERRLGERLAAPWESWRG